MRPSIVTKQPLFGFPRRWGATCAAVCDVFWSCCLQLLRWFSDGFAFLFLFLLLVKVLGGSVGHRQYLCGASSGSDQRVVNNGHLKQRVSLSVEPQFVACIEDCIEQCSFICNTYYRFTGNI